MQGKGKVSLDLVVTESTEMTPFLLTHTHTPNKKEVCQKNMGVNQKELQMTEVGALCAMK